LAGPVDRPKVQGNKGGCELPKHIGQHNTQMQTQKEKIADITLHFPGLTCFDDHISVGHQARNVAEQTGKYSDEESRKDAHTRCFGYTDGRL